MSFCQRCGGKLYQDGKCPNCDLGMGGPELERTQPVSIADFGTEWSNGPMNYSGGGYEPTNPEYAEPVKKKKIGLLIVICICAAVLIAGVVFGAIMLSKKMKEKKREKPQKKKTKMWLRSANMMRLPFCTSRRKPLVST